jgi:hypothetical protein
MAMTDAALRSELQADPAGLGYASHLAAGNHQALADLLNWPRDGVTAPPVAGAPTGAAITVRNPSISAADLLEAIDNRDFATSPNAAHVAWFESITQQRTTIALLNEDGSNNRVLGNLNRLITSDTQGSRTRLLALATRRGSRAEQLWGPGTVVTIDDIGRALAG